MILSLSELTVCGIMLMAESAIPKWYELRLWSNALRGIISRNCLGEVITAVFEALTKPGQAPSRISDSKRFVPDAGASPGFVGSTWSQVNVTMKCLKCHKGVRNTVLAESAR